MPPLVAHEFSPDEGQRAALEAIRLGDTLLIAPTGYGKSWVAYEAAREVLAAGGDVFYTTPLKALSNQKYTDLKTLLGEGSVGIVTGDRQENAAAPALVMTTEILRNMLAEGQNRTLGSRRVLIILDECHWMADPERGTTWEEIVLLAPPSARLLLLSASVGNGPELATWITRTRGRAPRLIMVGDRPVPQRWGILDARGEIWPLDEALGQAVRFHAEPSLPRVAAALKEYDLTPALVFLPTRRGCDLAASACSLARETPGVVARAHHAGRTLRERLGVEEELREGTVDVVFCTTTLASGIDAPVRTVVLASLEDGQGVVLSPTIIQQMAGRAGRRGRDTVGFVLGLPTSRSDLALLDEVRRLPPSPVNSAFVPTYQTTLLLAMRLGENGARDFAARSLARFQKAEEIAALNARVARLAEPLADAWRDLEPRSCDDPASTWATFQAARQKQRRARHDQRRQRGEGFLCRLGLGVPRGGGADQRFVVLTRDGTLIPAPRDLQPLPVDEEAKPEVQRLISSLLNGAERDSWPIEGQWYRIARKNAAPELRRVERVADGRIYFDGGRPVPVGQWRRLSHTVVRPGRLAGPVRALLDRIGPTRARHSEPDGEPLICPACPVFEQCADQQRRVGSIRARLERARRDLQQVDPVARIETTLKVLRTLEAYDPRTLAPTDFGRALLATHDPAGLFFALQRHALGKLSPRALAAVVAATRDVRTGRVLGEGDPLPRWYARAVREAARIEDAAGGFQTLAVLLEEATAPGTASAGRRGRHREQFEVPLSFAARRAQVLHWLWAGEFPAEEEIAPGDAERLLLMTVDALRELRAVPELAVPASAAYEHLRVLAEAVLAV